MEKRVVKGGNGEKKREEESRSDEAEKGKQTQVEEKEKGKEKRKEKGTEKGTEKGKEKGKAKEECTAWTLYRQGVKENRNEEAKEKKSGSNYQPPRVDSLDDKVEGKNGNNS